ncbi:hypothetical protein EB118_23265 [bacterium]|nr:hypothetical protein [bacterium]
MNERIRKLAEQAKLYNGWFCGQGNIEKFAELIVKECIANCDDLNSMKYIADHFGIKIEGLE